MKIFQPAPGLKKGLDSLYQKYSRTWIETDPVCIPHQYSSDNDIEIAAFIASALSYGKVSLFLPKITEVMNFLSPSPYASLKELSVKNASFPENFYYRFQTSRDLLIFLTAISKIINRYGSLRNLFLQGYDPDHPNIYPALDAFVSSFRDILAEDGENISHGLSHLIPRPGQGVMKRLNMFLRWMVRKDNVDFGIWPEIASSQLVIPVDTHINRISGFLNLTERKNADRKSAVEITNSLKKISPEDPVKYDFALTRLGMYYCSYKEPAKCIECVLRDYCSGSK